MRFQPVYSAASMNESVVALRLLCPAVLGAVSHGLTGEDE